MIPATDIRAWRNVAPWRTNEQIEQDLVLSRSLVEIYSNRFSSENQAFQGGANVRSDASLVPAWILSIMLAVLEN